MDVSTLPSTVPRQIYVMWHNAATRLVHAQLPQSIVTTTTLVRLTRAIPVLDANTPPLIATRTTCASHIHAIRQPVVNRLPFRAMTATNVLLTLVLLPLDVVTFLSHVTKTSACPVHAAQPLDAPLLLYLAMITICALRIPA
jgi:hypothetical protein